jgi:hypothetical protein
MMNDESDVLAVINARLAHYDTGIRIISTPRGYTFMQPDDRRADAFMPLAAAIKAALGIIEAEARQQGAVSIAYEIE